jgi:hypothetical protein
VVSKSPGAFGQFSGTLKSAADRGQSSLAATDYILQQSNAEYRAQRAKVFPMDEERTEQGDE